jgi:hypothetical protein
VTGNLWWWIRSFLTNRSICVSAQGVTSAPHAISAGVPQGCVLSPTLFLIFINDIVNSCPGCRAALFADDVALWPRSVVTPKDSTGQMQLQATLDKFSVWASDWRMIFNVDKSCVVRFTAQGKTSSSSSNSIKKNKISKKQFDPLSITFNLCQQQLPTKEQFSYLGVVFHAHGRWNAHFDKVLPKVRYAVRCICKIIRRNHHPTVPVIVELVKTRVLPIITYGFPVIRYSQTQCDILESLILMPIKRSMPVYRTSSHDTLFFFSQGRKLIIR